LAVALRLAEATALTVPLVERINVDGNSRVEELRDEESLMNVGGVELMVGVELVLVLEE
jgi:hypothetical protein